MQQTSATEGVSQNFSSRVSISNNIDNSWNFDGPYFTDNSIAFNTEINNNITQNYELVNLVSGVTPPAGVTQIVAGQNINLPNGGTGVVTIEATLSGGTVDCTAVQNCISSYWGGPTATTEMGLLNGASFSSTGLTFTSRNVAFNNRGMRTDTGTGLGTSVTIADTNTWPAKYTWGRITGATAIGGAVKRWLYTLTELSVTTSGTADLVFANGSSVTALNEVELGNASGRTSGYDTGGAPNYYINNATGYSVSSLPVGTIVRLTKYYVEDTSTNPSTYIARYSFNAQNPVVGQCPA